MEKIKQGKVFGTPTKMRRDSSFDSNPSPSFNAADVKDRKTRRQHQNAFKNSE